MRPQGVDVVVVEPGQVKTPIWRKGNGLAADLQAGMSPEAERLFGPMVEALRAETVKIERVRARAPATWSAGTPGGVVRWRRCCPTALWTGSARAMSS